MNHEFRFGGIERLYGPGSLDKLTNARVLVVGLGGVGTWVVESLARTGVGNFILMDMDEFCESNINRQLQAMGSTIGKPKISQLHQRILDINPQIECTEVFDFFTRDSFHEVLDQEIDLVIDCIDGLSNKALLIAETKKRSLPVVTTGGAGGKIDPSKIKIADLANTLGDPLLGMLRKKLRKNYGFDRGKGVPFDVDCVFSDEDRTLPNPDTCGKAQSESLKMDCASGLGSAAHLTGSFGLFAASLAVNRLLER